MLPRLKNITVGPDKIVRFDHDVRERVTIAMWTLWHGPSTALIVCFHQLRGIACPTNREFGAAEVRKTRRQCRTWHVKAFVNAGSVAIEWKTRAGTVQGYFGGFL